MITEPTVFILGAGASQHLKYPLGRGLKQHIIDITQQNSPQERKLINASGFEDAYIKRFRDDLMQSPRPSIDWFLQENPDYIEFGKLLIAQALIPKELPIYWDGKTETWYEYIFNKVISDFNRIGANRASFITFNYDRSLEYYLFNSIIHSFFQSNYMKTEEVIEALSYIKIIHVHGILGQLPWLDDSARVRNYSPERNIDILKKSAQEIRIVHESTENDAVFTEARELIDDAKNIHFLGFGYNEDNMARLGFPHDGNTKHIRGTVMHFNPNQKREIADRFRLPIGDVDTGYDILGYLKNYPINW